MKSIELNVGNEKLNVFVNEQDGEQWIAVKPLCEAVGLEFKRQRQKLLSNPQFKGRVHMYPSLGGNQESLCIPVKQLGMWICNINANKVRSDVKDRILNCQMHLQVAIHQYMTGQITPELVQALRQEILELREHAARQDILIDRIATAYLENDAAKRYEDSQKSFGGKLLSAARWTKRDRERIKQEMTN